MGGFIPLIFFAKFTYYIMTIKTILDCQRKRYIMELIGVACLIVAIMYTIKTIFGIFRDMESGRQVNRLLAFTKKMFKQYGKLLEQELGD